MGVHFSEVRVVLFRSARRFTNMFWKWKHSKVGSATSFENSEELDDIRARLFDSPLHRVSRKEVKLPKDEDGLGWASGIKDRRWAFSHFNGFENQIHTLHEKDSLYDIGPWRLEQLSDPYLMKFGIDDGPVVGLRCKIYYNSEKVGDLEINPMSEPSPENMRKNHEAALRIDIYPAPFLPHEHVSSFLHSCVLALFPSAENSSRNTSITSAMTATMWESNRQDSMWVGLDFYYFGFASLGHKIKAKA